MNVAVAPDGRTVHNADVAEVFYRLAELLEIEGANPFRIRAYRRAAATIEDLTEPVAALLARGQDLADLPGIGEDLAGKIAEICRTGRLQLLEDVEARTPSDLARLAQVPGLGPKRVKVLHDALGVNSIEDLARAAAAGRIRDLPRFGEAFEQRLLRDLKAAPATGETRLRISVAEEYAAGLLEHVKALPGVGEAVVAGSYRRRRETVGDLDILASGPPSITDGFVGYAEVVKVLAKGPTRVTAVLRNGLQVDLRVVPDESFGAALVYFTGSKAHNIALRKRAQGRGLKVNEYGVFRGEARLAGRTEADVYRAVGLPLIPPELREDRGELDAAEAGRLPTLVQRADLKGDLHVHTRASDGKSTLAEMVEAARALGYEYLAISDHSRHAVIAHGLDPARLSAQLDEIDALNARGPGIRVLKSCEVDILKNGRLDLPDRLLARLDVVTAGVHSDFALPAAAQTERLLKAMDNRHVHILAHPTGRLIGERTGYQVDLDKVIAGAKDRGCFLEVNAHPSRLDLDDVHARAAKAAGVLIAVGSDAHSSVGLANIRFGVDQARRGWLEPNDVLNTRTWPDLRTLLVR
ncbi:DNA polymerase/3'-5' exonuclease PolX [Phenylobacterium sp.]|uniref:DNA polymerase/3'-5' exonuclease PolX n=1 Tax=Phenylobacterium sp. TaxID=1871053 RepID=UPI002ED7999F